MLHHCLHCCCLPPYNTPLLGIHNNVFQCGEFHAKLLAVPRSQAFPLNTVVNDLKYGEHQSCVIVLPTFTVVDTSNGSW